MLQRVFAVVCGIFLCCLTDDLHGVIVYRLYFLPCVPCVHEIVGVVPSFFDFSVVEEVFICFGVVLFHGGEGLCQVFILACLGVDGQGFCGWFGFVDIYFGVPRFFCLRW